MHPDLMQVVMSACELRKRLKNGQNYLRPRQFCQFLRQLYRQMPEIPSRQLINTEMNSALVDIGQLAALKSVFVDLKHLQILSQLVEDFPHALMRRLVVRLNAPHKHFVDTTLVRIHMLH